MTSEKSPGAKLVELFVIFAMVLGVALLVLRKWEGLSENKQRSVTVNRMLAIEAGLAKYMIDAAGALPTGEQGLAALLREPASGPRPVSWKGPYVDSEEVLKDAWGRDFQYFCPGQPVKGHPDIHQPYSLSSYGADGAEGGEGMDRDICSWKRTTMIP